MRILYLLSPFPNFNSETFILNEMIELEKMGNDVWVLADVVNQVPESELHGIIAENDFMKKVIVGKNYLRGRDKLWDFVRLVPRDLIFSPVMTIRNFYLVFLKGDRSPDNDIWLKMENYLVLRRIPILKFDIVYAPFAHIAKVIKGLSIAEVIKTPFVAAFRALELYGSAHSDNIRLQRQIFDKIDSLVTISRFNKEYLENDLGFKDVSLVHSSIDTDRFAPPTVKPASEKIRLVTIARLVEKKGITYLLEALAILKKEGSQFKYTLVGLGPLMGELEKQIEKLGLSENVNLLVPMKQELIKELLENSDIMVLPCIVAANGDRDIMPNVLKEAMSMEVPVITTSISDIEELITDGEDGILISEKNVDALVAAIKRLAGDEALRKQIGQAGRRKVVKYFSVKNEARKLVEVFASAIKKYQRPPADFKRRSLDIFDEIKYRCDGMMDPEVYSEIYHCAYQAENGDMLELGAAHGAATVSITRGIIDSRKNSILYSVEKGQGLGSSMQKFGSKRYNIAKLEDNLEYFGCQDNTIIIDDNITQAVGRMKGVRKFSLLMIDADGAIDRDFRFFYNNCLPGAYIIIDDYENVKDISISSVHNPFGKSYTTFLLVNYFLKIGLLKKEKNIGRTIFCRKPENIIEPVIFNEAELSRIREDITQEYKQVQGLL